MHDQSSRRIVAGRTRWFAAALALGSVSGTWATVRRVEPGRQACQPGEGPFKIMSPVCQSLSADTPGHAATRDGMKPNDCRDVMASGDTSQHQI
jgi:hypothetical protein